MPSMDDVTKELGNLQLQINEAKRNVAIFEDRIQESLKRLRDEFGIASLNDAIKEAGKLKTEIVSLEADIQSKHKTLKETYTW